MSEQGDIAGLVRSVRARVPMDAAQLLCRETPDRIRAVFGVPGRVAALGRRLVILPEGGYHRPSLGENARAWLRGAEGRPFEPLHECRTLEDYRTGLVPLIVPITLIRHHVRARDVAYLRDQIYLSPHPKELMLRNHV